MRLSEVDTWLYSAGFTLNRQNGSHRHYRNTRGQRLTLSVHGGPHTTLGWRQIAQIRQDMDRLARWGGPFPATG